MQTTRVVDVETHRTVTAQSAAESVFVPVPVRRDKRITDTLGATVPVTAGFALPIGTSTPTTFGQQGCHCIDFQWQRTRDALGSVSCTAGSSRVKPRP